MYGHATAPPPSATLDQEVSVEIPPQNIYPNIPPKGYNITPQAQPFIPGPNINLLKNCPNDLLDLTTKLVSTQKITLKRRTHPKYTYPHLFNFLFFGKNLNKERDFIDILTEQGDLLFKSENTSFSALCFCGQFGLSEDKTILKYPLGDKKVSRSKVSRGSLNNYCFGNTKDDDIQIDRVFENSQVKEKIGSMNILKTNPHIVKSRWLKNRRTEWDHQMLIKSSQGNLKYLINTQHNWADFVTETNHKMWPNSEPGSYCKCLYRHQNFEQVIFNIHLMQDPNIPPAGLSLEPERYQDARIVGNLRYNKTAEGEAQYILTFPDEADWRERLMLVHFMLYQEKLVEEGKVMMWIYLPLIVPCVMILTWISVAIRIYLLVEKITEE